MLRLPGAQDALSSGLPASLDLSQDFRQIYDQGAEPSCVAFSTCGLTSAFDWLADAGWDNLDGHRLYRACGGTGSNGIDTRATLEFARTQGVPLLSGAGSIKIGSYVFATQQPVQFRQEIAAALSAGHFCTVALLLPMVFGWSSSGSATPAYHQVVICGYTGLGEGDYAIFVNSWGASWGNGGKGRVTWSYLEGGGFQGGYVYAYAVTPLVLPKPDPNPPPPAKVSISGYGRATETVPALRPQQPFDIRGTGLAAITLSFTVADLPAEVVSRNDQIATLLAPDTKVPLLGAVAALRGGQAVATGPLVVVAPRMDPFPPPPPPPPGTLSLEWKTNPTGALFVWAKENEGYVEALVTVTGVPATAFHNRTGPNGTPATFRTTAHGQATVTALATDGNSGTVTVTV